MYLSWPWPVGSSRFMVVLVMRMRAFTLIEVLVVVAIIALLVAILLPALGRAREQSRTSICASNQKQMGIAMSLFATEHGGRVPRGLSRHGTPDPTGPVNWVRMVARMFGDKNNYAANFNRVPVEKYPVFSCPTRSREYGGVFLDYVVNSLDHRGPMRIPPCEPDPSSGTWYEVEGVTKIDVWQVPGDTIYVTEAVEESWNVSDPNNSNSTLRGIRENIARVRRPTPPSETGYDWFDVAGGLSLPTLRVMVESGGRKPRASLQMHRTGSNAVHVDGHVELLRPPTRNVQLVHEYYLRKFGMDRRRIRGSSALTTTAILSPCAAGDTKWRP